MVPITLGSDPKKQQKPPFDETINLVSITFRLDIGKKFLEFETFFPHIFALSVTFVHNARYRQTIFFLDLFFCH